MAPIEEKKELSGFTKSILFEKSFSPQSVELFDCVQNRFPWDGGKASRHSIRTFVSWRLLV